MATRTPSSPDPDQRRRFEEMARELGCDEDEGAFKEKLAAIARQKPRDEPTKIDDKA
jgi:hypothetical protein